METIALEHANALHLDAAAGVMQLQGERALLIDATAMGALRKSLVENFGARAARTVLMQFGFAQGWRMAESTRSRAVDRDDVDLAGLARRAFAGSGLCSIAPSSEGALSPSGAVMSASFEAEQHLLHFGRASEVSCWLMAGLFSGFWSCVTGTEVFVLEDACLARGDPACHLVGHTREGWAAREEGSPGFFEARGLTEALEGSFARVIEALKAVANSTAHQHRPLKVTPLFMYQSPPGIVAQSASMRAVVDLARRVARVDATVLLTGESGTGKERIARLVHDESPRASGPFIAVNCGAITETLLESELFGHARGAFTGASHDRPGLFEAAHHGTLLLDEIGEVSPGMQVKLLRALQAHEVRRVGENKSRAVDVRIVAATNRDLGAAVAAGTFRENLYYRLKVVELHVPALRDRHEDVLPLARALLATAAERMHRTVTGLSPGAVEALQRARWPGNVRQLENAIERAVALTHGVRVEVDDLPGDVFGPAKAPADLVTRPLEDIEREYILAALALNGGHQARTAKQLDIGTATLYRKLKGYGVLKGSTSGA